MRMLPVLSLAILGLLGCKGTPEGSPGPSSPTHVVYSLDNDRDALSTYWADAEGRLTPHDPGSGPLTGPPNALDLAFDGPASRLYAFGGYGATKVMDLFTLAADGTPTLASPLALPAGTSGWCFDPSFHALYVLDQDLGVIDGYQVQADGTAVLHNPASGAVPAGPGTQLVLDPSGTFLYAPGDAAYWVYRLQPDGTLLAVSPAEGTPWDYPYDLLVPAPSGARMYCLASAQARIILFDIQADGTLTASPLPAATVTLPAGTLPCRLVFSPGGNVAYCANAGAGTVSAFTVQADGTLTALGQPITSGNGIVDLALDPEGRTLYAANEDAGTLTVFRIQADGTLALLQGGVAAGVNPIKLVVR